MAKAKSNLVQSMIYAGLGLIIVLLVAIMALLLYALIGEQWGDDLSDIFSDASVIERTLEHPGVPPVSEMLSSLPDQKYPG